MMSIVQALLAITYNFLLAYDYIVELDTFWLQLNDFA
jgi:hypothetical protein